MNTDSLQKRWFDLCEEHGQENPNKTWAEIEFRHTEEHRAYHTLEHIAAMLETLDAHAQLVDDAVSLEFAVWLHDLIYDTEAKDNEAQSAKRAREILTPPLNVETISALILATDHLTSPDSEDAKLLCDIDLAILGAEPTLYAIYHGQIREEYKNVPADAYRKGRSAVLRRFLDRPRIYATDAFHDRFEQAARWNLEAEIQLWEM